MISKVTFNNEQILTCLTCGFLLVTMGLMQGMRPLIAYLGEA